MAFPQIWRFPLTCGSWLVLLVARVHCCVHNEGDYALIKSVFYAAPMRVCVCECGEYHPRRRRCDIIIYNNEKLSLFIWKLTLSAAPCSSFCVVVNKNKLR